MNPIRELREFFHAALVAPVDQEPEDTPGQKTRRRVATAVTLVAGAVALWLTLTITPGDPRFYLASLGVALVWVAGALASGKLYLGQARTRDGRAGPALLHGFLLGFALLVVFCAGAVVISRVPVLVEPVERLLDHARFGSLPLVAAITAVSGVAEELFFRGALYAALQHRWKVIGSTLLYGASTLGSGVPLLTFAALTLGLLTALQRRVTGGVLGPIVCHLTWSLGMLFVLPPLFGALR